MSRSAYAHSEVVANSGQDVEGWKAVSDVTHTGSVTDLVDEYRRVRDELELSVLPLATSVDGRQFTFQASLHGLQLQTGGYVVLEGDGARRLGQILTMHADSALAHDVGLETMKSSMLIRLAEGEGVILDGDLRT